MVHQTFKDTVSSFHGYCKAFILGGFTRFQKLRWLGKLVIIAFLLFYVALVVAFLVIGPGTIFQYFFNLSRELRRLQFGWLICGVILVVASFPPVVGFYTCVSITGFAWGLKGFYIAGPGALTGAGLSFLSLRFLFKRRLAQLQQANTHWRALDQVVAAKGLPLIILIRFSPIPPWVYSTALFASITSVKFWQFMVANLFLLPKILLTVFVASRVAALADKDHRGEMDTTTKLLNYGSVALGVIVGLGTGWFVYSLTQQKIKELPEVSREVGESAADALRDAEQGAPLLRDFSPEPEDDEPLSPATKGR